MFVGLVTRATWRSPIQASGSKRYNIKHYNTNNGVKRGKSNTIRYKTIEHEHWGPKRLTQRPISDEWKKTQSGTVGGMYISENSQTKKRKWVVYRALRRKKCCTKMMACETVQHFYISASLSTPNESGYTNSPQRRVTIDNLVDTHFGVQ